MRMIPQVAQYFAVHPNTIKREIKDGKLEALKKGRVTIITKAALADYLRRTAARNFDPRGIGCTTAMKMGGWKTASIYDRCNIVSDENFIEAVATLETGFALPSLSVPFQGAPHGASRATAELADSPGDAAIVQEGRGIR